MKLSIFFSIVFALGLSANSQSQTQRLTIDRNNVTIAEIFSDIEAKSDFSLLYSPREVDVTRRVTVQGKELLITDILSSILAGNKDIGYRITEKHIILFKNDPFIQETALSQGITITGAVVDETGASLPGVNVVVKGTATGVISNVDGNYSITVPGTDAVLVFSFVGYLTQEIAVSNQTVIAVTMSEDVAQIDEVIVVGYGTQRKVSLTGSVSQVSGSEVAAKSSTSVVTALQGMMPGVNVLRTSGQPGSENNGLRVRGFSSVNEVSALILIDGVEGSLTYLNPDDIESVSVLKDASTAAIYGSRAAGGVVLVTTKKGSSLKTKITYSGSFGINMPGMMPQHLSPWEEQDFIQQANTIGNNNKELNWDWVEWIASPNYNHDLHPSTATRYQAQIGNTNWLNEGTRDYTLTHRHSVSLSGGHGKTTYFLSGRYYTQNGMLKYGPDSNDRYNLRASIRTEMNNYLDFRLNTSYESSQNFRNAVSHNTIMSYMYNNRGRMAMYLSEDDINYDHNPYQSDIHVNPLNVMKNAGTSTAENRYMTASANLHIKNVVKGLTLDLNASRRFGVYSLQTNGVYLPGLGHNGLRGANDIFATDRTHVRKTKNTSNQDKLEALLNYRLNFNKHEFGLMVGSSYENYLLDQISGRARYLFSDNVFSFNAYESSVDTNSLLEDSVRPWKMASIFGRFNYSYANRYLLEFVTRYDGSSRLAPGNRFGFFPGVSGGWIISEEAFFEPAKEFVNLLKLRASYGEVGNSTVLNNMYYPYIGTLRAGSVMGQNLFYQRNMTSADVTWESLTSTNIAVDMAFLRNRLTLTAEYYWKTTNNMLSPMSPGNIVGAEVLPSENIGKLKTWGWEISAGWRDRIGDFRYSVSFNIDDSHNELVEYRGVNTIAAGTIARLEGYPLNTLWGYQTDGFWKSREEYLAYKDANPGYLIWEDAKIAGGDVRYVSQRNAEHQIGVGGGTPENPGDLIHLGDANGRYFFGINLGAQWKGFDFSCLFQGVGKRSFFINNGQLAPLALSYEMPFTVHRDYWREDNQDAYFARLWANSTSNYQYADRWVQNGAYIRLKNIQLGYTVPVAKYIESLRIYVSGTDLWEHTTLLKIFDPEIGNRVKTATDVDNVNDRVGRGSYYPFFRTWTVGLNLTF